MKEKIKKIDWIQLVTVLITISGLFLWARNETNKSVRFLDRKIDRLGVYTDHKINDLHNEVDAVSKDTHGRILVLEEKHKPLVKIIEEDQ